MPQAGKTEKEIVWEKISTLPDRYDTTPYFVPNDMPYMSARHVLKECLDMTDEEIDEIIECLNNVE